MQILVAFKIIVPGTLLWQKRAFSCRMPSRPTRATDDANGFTVARLAMLLRPADGDVVSVHVCIDTSLFNSFHCEYISNVSAKFHFAFIYTYSQPPVGTKVG